MIGHDDRCGAECKHLKKAMALKKKFFGTLYPVKKHNVQYVDFDLF